MQQKALRSYGNALGQAFQVVSAFSRFAQLVDRTPCNDLATVADKRLDNLAQVEYFRLAVHQRPGKRRRRRPALLADRQQAEL